MYRVLERCDAILYTTKCVMERETHLYHIISDVVNEGLRIASAPDELDIHV